MYLVFYICFIFLIPHIRGNVVSNSLIRSNVTHNIEVVSDNITNSTSSESPIKSSDVTKVIVTEGGSIVSKVPSISLPNESHSVDLTIIDKEIDKSKGKSIVPRKGVHYDSVEENPSFSHILNHTKERIDTTVNDLKVPHEQGIADSGKSSIIKSTQPPSSSSENIKEKPTTTILNPALEVHKKPTVLSSEAISESDRRAQLDKAKTESSSKSIVSDQLPSPSVKVEPAIHISHPDMIMPIVITILVVPMFAVLGYMALRRGQEAWKNRHYKRMDFLLDGMYND